MTNTKQQQQAPREREIVTPQKLMHRYKLFNDYIETIRKNNLDAGLRADMMGFFIPDTKLFDQEVLERFLKITTNKSGKWITPQSLEASGNVRVNPDLLSPEVEIPYVRLHRLTRVKVGEKEYLERIISVHCLTNEGNPTHKTIGNMDYWTKPAVENKYVSKDPKDPNGDQINVGRVLVEQSRLEPHGQRVWLVEYSPERVAQILEDFPPAGPFDDFNNGCCLCFRKPGVTNETPVKTLREFLEPFDTVWERQMGTPSSNKSSKVDIKDLIDEMQKRFLEEQRKKDEDHGQYQ